MAENAEKDAVQKAVRHALVVIDPDKLDLATAPEQTLLVLQKIMVDSALEDLGMTNPTKAQRSLLETAARNALALAASGQNDGVSFCVPPKER